ncbi:MAG: homocysteine S-methyltransferase family protein [Ilumatobacteraceae bacterium]
MATVTVLDGGIGRELLRIGAPFRQPEWSALALTDGPEWVVRAHRNFIEAGAQVITTNSYAVVPFHIGDARFRAEGRELAALSGRLAREAAATAPGITVAGSLPPLFGSYRPDLFDAVLAPTIIDPLIEGLRDHVDYWLGETLSSIAEVRAVRAGLDRTNAQATPLWISYHLDDDTAALPSGESVADAVSAAIDLGATAVMFNCCTVETIGAAIPIAVATSAGRAQIGGYANRFTVENEEGGEANERLSQFRNDLDPATYRAFVGDWLDNGATIIGGCCGITPDHIAALRSLVG